MRTPVSDLSAVSADILERIRAQRPRVHCITNAVAQTFTANMLLAAGAIPSMTIAAAEVPLFVKRANALLINLGTFDAERRTATSRAITAANKAGLPWVLDPVFIDRSKPRAAFARSLMAKSPRAVRLNQAEFEALTKSALDEASLVRYAKSKRTIIGLTGESDLVSDGQRLTTISNGDPLMARVTALGCAGSALLAACLAVEEDALIATSAALLVLAVAGEVAAKRARGPGSFAVEILDAVYGLNRATLRARAKVN